MIVRNEAVLEVATRTLLADPAASLADVARAAGMSRTSLHSRYPTRVALLSALAHEAMSLVEKEYVEARLDAVEPVDVLLRRLVEGLVPLGPRVEFLLRERALDSQPEVCARYEELDRPITALVERAQARGELDPMVPAWWVAASLQGLVFRVWEAVADGRVAAREAPNLVLRTLLAGLRPGRLTGASGPAGPAGPTGPTGPTGPADPADPAGLADPADPAGPTGTTGPADPAGLADPAGTETSSGDAAVGDDSRVAGP